MCEFSQFLVFDFRVFELSSFRVVECSGCRVFEFPSFEVLGRAALPPSFLFCFIVLALTCAWARLQPRPQLSKGAVATARPPLSFCTLRNVCVH